MPYSTFIPDFEEYMKGLFAGQEVRCDFANANFSFYEGMLDDGPDSYVEGITIILGSQSYENMAVSITADYATQVQGRTFQLEFELTAGSREILGVVES